WLAAPTCPSKVPIMSKREGRDEATRDLTGALESRVAETLDAINNQVMNLFEAYAQDKEEHSRDAVSVATVIVRKMFPALNMDKAMAEIEHMIVEAMKRTSGSPRLIMRVTPAMQTQVEAKTQELTALRGYQGTIKVIADEALGEGTAHVEWDGGGMIRDPATMWAEVDEIIERNLGERAGEHAAQAEKAAQDAHASPEPEPESRDEPPIDENHGENSSDDALAQEVVNSAPVGDNEESAVESPPEADVPPETAEETVLEDQIDGGELDDAEDNEQDSEQDG
ncbi:hypothetical protein ACFL12_04620, partial [Pseudomonadota bacterium]